ncbi:neuromodulin isoform X2 [Onthophagus taurus]|uniref:neuromodulin isoform X2 n=1 Tax=Onthophagus taurus TaxID=166361 RepID=UPI000C20E209|nr:neuromodulin isoform X2 [Onthophagus taurus]
MGCNTSKESVANVDEKDDIRIASDEQTDLRGDANCNQEKILQLPQALTNEIKEAVAKKVSESSDRNKETTKIPETKIVNLENEKSPETEGLEEAATKIQAAFRGHQTRKTMKQADKPEKNAETAEDLANEFKPDDPELCNAATKIQASFRGHMARKKIADKDGGEQEEAQADDEEDFDIDLADPDLNKAASKIQATFRTHMKHKDE